MTYTKRHLPHWHPPGQDIFITWRLDGSLPVHFRLLSQTESQANAKRTLNRLAARLQSSLQNIQQIESQSRQSTEFESRQRTEPEFKQTTEAKYTTEAQKCSESTRHASDKGKSFLHYDRALDRAETGPLWLKDPRIAQSIVAALRAAHEQNQFTLQAYALMANHVHVLLTPRSPLSQITGQIKGATARTANQILRRTGATFWQDESFDHWIRDPAEWHRIQTYIEKNPVSAGLVKNPEDWPWSSARK